jgi:sugar lactone lactonase YvrE
VVSVSNGVAVSRDGSTLLVSDCDGGSHAIHEFRVSDGSRLRVVPGQLQFRGPRQMCVAPNDRVFVAEYGNNRVQALTPKLDFDAFVGADVDSGLRAPSGVCADEHVVVLSEGHPAHRVSVFNRSDGAHR